MSEKLPTKYETKCAGISQILSHLLLIIASMLHAPVYKAYYVKSEEDVITLHNALSDAANMTDLQIICVIQWICFPLALMSVYGIKQILLAIVDGTSLKIFVYVLEKAYILFSLMFILTPAIMLTIISYDWEFDESGDIPAGYYIQLGFTVLHEELADCFFYADAIFLALILIVIRGIIWKANVDPKYHQLCDLLQPQCMQNARCCGSKLLFYGRECMFIGMPTAIFVSSFVVLCAFAKSGFFSPDSFAKYLLILVVMINIAVGVALVWLSRGNRLQQIETIINREYFEQGSENSKSQHEQNTGLKLKDQINHGGQMELKNEKRTPLIEYNDDEYPDTNM
eukprot:137838_1